MSSRPYIVHRVSTTQPAGQQLGDEWYNPVTNTLTKTLAVNGTTVLSRQILADVTGNIGISGNIISTGNIDSGNLRVTDTVIAGLVGVNTTPSRRLDVNGGARFVQDAAATTGAITLRQNSNDTVGAYIQWVNNANNVERGWLTVDTSNNMLFATGSTEKLRIDSDGLVSVGPTGANIIKARNTAKWWVTSNGFISILSSLGVASVTDAGSNTINITYSVATTGGLYAAAVSVSHAGGLSWNAVMNNSSAPSTTGTNYRFTYNDGGAGYNPFAWSAVGFGDQA
jgi:hypothetical protein